MTPKQMIDIVKALSSDGYEALEGINSDDFKQYRQYGYSSRKQMTSSSGDGPRFSEDNPYARQMNYVTSNDDLRKLEKSAIEWENSHANALQTREWQLEDRAYEEEQNSISHQIQEQRANGINPDLAGQSFTPVDSGDAPAQESNSLDPLKSNSDVNRENLGFAQGVVGVSADVVATVTGIMNFIEGCATFGDRIQRSSNSTAMSDLALASARDTFATSSARHILNRVDDNGEPIPVTDTSASDFLASTPYAGDSSMLSRVQGFLTDPSLLAQREDDINEYNRARTYRTVAGQTNYHETATQLALKNDLSSKRIQHSRNIVDETYANILANDDEYAQNLADSTTGQAKLDSDTVEAQLDLGAPRASVEADVARDRLTSRQLRYAYTQFGHAINACISQIKEYDAEIDKIEQTRKRRGILTSSEQIKLDTYRCLRTALYTQGAMDLHSFFSGQREFIQRKAYDAENSAGDPSNKGFSSKLRSFFSGTDSGMTFRELWFSDLFSSPDPAKDIVDISMKLLPLTLPSKRK